MSLVNPAHVGNAVTHGASMGADLLGFAGAAVGLVIAIAALPELAAGAAVLAAATPVALAGVLVSAGIGVGTVTTALTVTSFIGVVCTWGTAGMTAGKYAIDHLSDDAVAGHIVSGFPTVFLGPAVEQAARADDDTKADCHGDAFGWEGSKIVFLGNKPMSRVGDRLKCVGKIMEGIPTVAVGGDPSHEGEDPDEESDTVGYWETLVFDTGGLFGARGAIDAVVAGAGLVLDALDNTVGSWFGEGALPKGIKESIKAARGKGE
jgi:uncharacterized Zn-binding protein involved in type VI secretion